MTPAHIFGGSEPLELRRLSSRVGGSMHRITTDLDGLARGHLPLREKAALAIAEARDALAEAERFLATLPEARV